MKTYTQKQFKALNDFNQSSAEQTQTREKVSNALIEAQSSLVSKETEYDLCFKAGVIAGSQDQSKLDALETEIETLKKAVRNAEKTQQLTFEALPDLMQELPLIVEKFRTEFTPAAREELTNIEERLQMGFDLILSARKDHDNLTKAYRDLTEEISKHSDANHKSGRTSALMVVSNPVERLDTTPKRIVERLVAAHNSGVDSTQYNYIHETPVSKGAK